MIFLSPGWCSTDMTPEGPRSAQEGGSMVVLPLVMPNPEKTNGAYYANSKVVRYDQE
jgi:hypothetical protein